MNNYKNHKQNGKYVSSSVTELEDDDITIKQQPTKLEDYFFPCHRLKTSLEGIVHYSFTL